MITPFCSFDLQLYNLFVVVIAPDLCYFTLAAPHFWHRGVNVVQSKWMPDGTMLVVVVIQDGTLNNGTLSVKNGRRTKVNVRPTSFSYIMLSE